MQTKPPTHTPGLSVSQSGRQAALEETIVLPSAEELAHLHAVGRCSFLCPICYDEACRWHSLDTELRDAWKGEGNSSRITFKQWLREMADNPNGTLQEAAKAAIRAKASGAEAGQEGGL